MPVQTDPTTHKVLVDAATRKVLNCACGLVGDCPHSISVTVQFDDTDTSTGDFLEFVDSGSNSGFSLFAFNKGDGTHAIETYSVAAALGDGFCDIIIPDAEFFNAPINICVQLSVTAALLVQVDVTITGWGSCSFVMNTPCFLSDTIYAGNRFGSGEIHRSISSIKVSGAEATFNFPTDSFDSFVGGASIVGGALRIDGSGDAYGFKTLGAGSNLGCGGCGACCHPDGTCDIRTRSSCVNISGNYHGDGRTCDGLTCAGACCVAFDTGCEFVTKEQCHTDFGTYHGDGVTCGSFCGSQPPNTCPCGVTSYGAVGSVSCGGDPDICGDFSGNTDYNYTFVLIDIPGVTCPYVSSGGSYSSNSINPDCDAGGNENIVCCGTADVFGGNPGCTSESDPCCSDTFTPFYNYCT